MKAFSLNMIFIILDVDADGQRLRFESEAYFHHENRAPCAEFDMPQSNSDVSDEEIFADLGFWCLCCLINRAKSAQRISGNWQSVYKVPVIFIADIKGQPRLYMSEERYHSQKGRISHDAFKLPNLDPDALFLDQMLLHDLGKKIFKLIEYP